MAAGSRSWGYNPASPFAIESDYGGPDGLKAFVKALLLQKDGGIMDLGTILYLFRMELKKRLLKWASPKKISLAIEKKLPKN